MRGRRAALIAVSARGGGALGRAMRAPQSPQNFCPRGTMARHEAQMTLRSGLVKRPEAPSLPLSEARSAAANSSAFWKRRLASFCRALRVISTSGSGMSRSGATTLGSGGGSERCISTTCVGVSASKGRRPARSWKRMTPHA